MASGADKPLVEILSKCGYRCDLCLAYGPNVEREDRRTLLSDGWHTIYGFRIEPEKIVCDGCVSGENPRLVDKGCPVRPCVVAKGLENCGRCNDYVCDKLRQRIVSRAELEKNIGRKLTEKEYELFVKPYESRERLENVRSKCEGKCVGKPFWESTYKDLGASTFGSPSREIIEISAKLPKGSKVLDIGCGEGRNALFLAETGFDVDAFDISESGIEKMNHIAKSKNIKINSFVKDMAAFKFGTDYDFIISHGVLHLTRREIWKRMIEEMKLHTRKNGVNVVVVFTDSLTIPDDLKEYCVGLFVEGEIKDYYQDWSIESYRSYDFFDSHPDGTRHHHAANKLIAWKK